MTVLFQELGQLFKRFLDINHLYSFKPQYSLQFLFCFVNTFTEFDLLHLEVPNLNIISLIC